MFQQSAQFGRELEPSPFPLRRAVGALVLAALWGAAPAFAQAKPAEPAPEGEAAAERELPKGMVEGPIKAQLGIDAEIDVPAGAVFADAPATRTVLERSGNLTNGREVGMIFTEGAQVLFSFDPVGYVRDDDKDALDAEKMLASIREGQEEANKELKKRGMPQLSIDRWQVKPHYEQSTHNLEWGPVVKNKENGHESVNYNVRLLGRRGVMEVMLLTDPNNLEQALPWFRTTLSKHAFKKGSDYASFVQGDKVAEYGLAALVTGGGLAVAAKSGLLGKLWKFILLGIAALGGALKKLFSRGKPGPLGDQQNPTE